MSRVMEPRLGNLYLFHHGFNREEIDGVVKLYTEKYGILPTLLMVHSSLNRDGWTKHGAIEIDTSDNVPQGHGWLGVEKGREKVPAVPPGEIKTPVCKKHTFPRHLAERTLRKPSRPAYQPVPRWITLSMRRQMVKILAPVMWARARQVARAHTRARAHQAQWVPVAQRLYAQWLDQRVTKDSPLRDFIWPDGMITKVPYMVKVAAPIPGLQPAVPAPAPTPADVRQMIAATARKLQPKAYNDAARAEQADSRDKGWRKGDTVEAVRKAIDAWKKQYGSAPARILVPEFRGGDLKRRADVWNVPLVSDKSVKPGSFRLIAAEVPKPTARVQAQSVRASSGL